MRRHVAIALTLGASCLLLFGCSDSTDPAGPVVVDQTDPDKRPPIIADPPPGFDQYLYGLNARFSQISWVEHVVTIYPDGTPSTVTIGDDEVEMYYEVDPLYLAMAAAAPVEGWECSIFVPEEPSGGTLFVPGDCVVFKTADFPDKVFGSTTIIMPIFDFYDIDEEFDGTFTSYSLELNEYGFPGATEVQTVQADTWPAPTEVKVYVEVPEITDKDNDEPDTKRVLDPADIGPPPDPDPGDDI